MLEADVRLSEFWIAISGEFGDAYGRTIVHDLVLTELDGLTGSDALASGVAPRDVWLAICAASDVPEPRRHGVGRLRDA